MEKIASIGHLFQSFYVATIFIIIRYLAMDKGRGVVLVIVHIIKDIKNFSCNKQLMRPDSQYPCGSQSMFF
jgi:hypothetical protein